MSAIKVFSKVEYMPGAAPIYDTSLTRFPENPKGGQHAIVSGVPYVYTSIDGDDPVWVPMGIKRLNSVVTIAEPQLEWIVEHNLSTFDLVASVYDVNNKLMDAPFTIISANVIKYSFVNPVKGKAVVFGASQKYAGYAPSVNQITGETVSVGTGEPSATTTSTLYIQVDSATA
jgi:hypothetical protein